MSDQVIEQLIGKVNFLQDRISELERREHLSEGNWVDYSSISTIVGWSSFTLKQLNYKTIGRLVLVQFAMSGTSNSTSTTFTLPYTNSSNSSIGVIVRIKDNSGAYAVGFAALPSSLATVGLFTSVTGSSWTASNTKEILGQFWYIKA